MTATPRSTATARRKRRKARTGHRSLAERLRAAVHSAGACRVAETVAGRVPEESCESCEERPARDAPDTVCGGTPQPLGSTARTWIVSQPSVRWSASSAQAAPRLSSIHNPQSSIPNPQSSILNPQSLLFTNDTSSSTLTQGSVLLLLRLASCVLSRVSSLDHTRSWSLRLQTVCGASRSVPDGTLLMSSWFALQYFLPQKCARYAISLMVFIFCGFCASLRLTECIPT
jgi:hypothetical protein